MQKAPSLKFDVVLNTRLNFVLRLDRLNQSNKFRVKSKLKFRDIQETSHNITKMPFKGPLRNVLKTSSNESPWEVNLRRL